MKYFNVYKFEFYFDIFVVGGEVYLYDKVGDVFIVVVFVEGGVRG